MGSFQQIVIGMICLAAAFFFGNYVNNNPPLISSSGTPVAGFSQFSSEGNPAQAISGNVRSQLPISNFAPIENKPAPIVTMKTPLKSRFTVPTIQTAPVEISGPAGSQLKNPLPPPSQLAAPKRPAELNQRSADVVFKSPFSASPFAEPAAVSPTIQVPDFSAIAAEFKNTPIELPNMSRLGAMPSYSNMDQQEPDHLVNRYNTAPPKNSAPLKQLVRQLPDNGFRNPNLERLQRQTAEPQPQLNVNQQRYIEPWNQTNAPQQGFSEADFEPNLNENLFGLKPRPQNDFKNTPEQNDNRLQSVSNQPMSGYQYDYAQPPKPLEPQIAGERTTSGFRGNLRFRPELENRSLQSNRSQSDEARFISSAPRRRQAGVTRQAPPRDTQPNFARAQSNARGLPFGLTDQAKTELVQLRDRADSMIGLESTNFVDHTIQEGETLQTISARYFGSPNYYLDIYLANRNKLRNPADTPAGVSIRVPVYESN